MSFHWVSLQVIIQKFNKLSQSNIFVTYTLSLPELFWMIQNLTITSKVFDIARLLYSQFNGNTLSFILLELLYHRLLLSQL